MPVKCRKCGGEGKWIREKDRCKVCKGKKMKQEEKTVDVQIPPGARQHDKVVIKGVGHQVEDRLDGDVTFVLKEVEHKVFHRMGADLGMKYILTLKQALCGYEIYIPHVSGRLLQVTTKPGEVTQPGKCFSIISYLMLSCRCFKTCLIMGSTSKRFKFYKRSFIYSI